MRTTQPLILLLAAALLAPNTEAQAPDALNRLLDRIAKNEQEFIQQIRTRTPLLETYVQETTGEGAPEAAAVRDHYFLGRLNLASGIEYTPIVTRSESAKLSRLLLFKSRGIVFTPVGFAQMIFMDSEQFARSHYKFDYVRREFVGDLRTLVFDVAPHSDEAGRFIGRIWVEDRDYRVVRFNGTYTGSSPSRMYFHFESWRLPTASGAWIPALIYVEETGQGARKGRGGSFKAQARLWGYNSGRAARADELTSVLIEMDNPVRDERTGADNSPLDSQRSWERQAEENILERLERGGMLAPRGSVDDVLDGVVQNLIATNNLDIEARCRVLLTTPLETFSVGNTIVISRGLLDVLPDEASLAMVLSDELAHIALAHLTNTRFAFHNQTMFSDHELLERFRFIRSEEEIDAAGKKAVEMLGKSPYKEKMSNAGLFLKALANRAPRYPNLIRANIGNALASGNTLTRMQQLTLRAPDLLENKLEQIPALPLGSRVKLDPWANTISLMKTKPVSLLSAREKLLFEVTPFAPHLTRVETRGKQSARTE